MTQPTDGPKPRRRPAAGRREAEDTPAAGDTLDVVDLVRRLGVIVGELTLSEVEVAHGDLRVRVQRTAPVAPTPPSGSTMSIAAPTPAAATEVGASALVTVEAPMVGTFYRASSPTADPYVREGDLVKHGQILCIIEAMKLMNEIESKVSGRIVKILVENGQPVEYDQPLFLIDPR
jgi:acetyl-CoA carboxylase biotin carboxyl carrier protein